jgi:hypothetical protein
MKFCIYKIYKEGSDDDLFYIGSSKKADNIKQRLYEHKCAWNKNLKMKCASSSLFEKYKEDKDELKKINIIILEEFELESYDKKKVFERENYFILLNRDKCLNKRMAIYNKDEYNKIRRKRYHERKNNSINI